MESVFSELYLLTGGQNNWWTGFQINVLTSGPWQGRHARLSPPQLFTCETPTKKNVLPQNLLFSLRNVVFFCCCSMSMDIYREPQSECLNKRKKGSGIYYGSEDLRFWYGSLQEGHRYRAWEREKKNPETYENVTTMSERGRGTVHQLSNITKISCLPNFVHFWFHEYLISLHPNHFLSKYTQWCRKGAIKWKRLKKIMT
jgi:hypothetical protein